MRHITLQWFKLGLLALGVLLTLWLLASLTVAYRLTRRSQPPFPELPTDSASLRFFRQRIASSWASSNRQRIASLCVSHDVFPPWSTG